MGTEIRAAVFVTWAPSCTAARDNRQDVDGGGRPKMHAKDTRASPSAATEDAQEAFPPDHTEWVPSVGLQFDRCRKAEMKLRVSNPSSSADSNLADVPLPFHILWGISALCCDSLLIPVN